MSLRNRIAKNLRRLASRIDGPIVIHVHLDGRDITHAMRHDSPRL